MTLPERISEKRLDLPLPDRDMCVSVTVSVQIASTIMMASTNTWSVNELTANFELPQATIMIQHNLPSANASGGWRPLALASHVFSCEAVLNRGCAQLYLVSLGFSPSHCRLQNVVSSP
jgi:hypothetical protein